MRARKEQQMIASDIDHRSSRIHSRHLTRATLSCTPNDIKRVHVASTRHRLVRSNSAHACRLPGSSRLRKAMLAARQARDFAGAEREWVAPATTDATNGVGRAQRMKPLPTSCRTCRDESNTPPQTGGGLKSADTSASTLQAGVESVGNDGQRRPRHVACQACRDVSEVSSRHQAWAWGGVESTRLDTFDTHT